MAGDNDVADVLCLLISAGPAVRSKRWLEGTPRIATVRVRLCCGKRSLQTRQVKRAQAVNEGT